MDFMELLGEYAKKFGEGFPMIPVAWGKTEKELRKIVEECIKKGKTAYELGYAKEDDEAVY